MTVRVQPGRKTISGELRCRVEGLEHLPIRPATARQVMSAAAETVSRSWLSCRGLVAPAGNLRP